MLRNDESPKAGDQTGFPKRRRCRQRRRLLMESLESRHLLALDGIQSIDAGEQGIQNLTNAALVGAPPPIDFVGSAGGPLADRITALESDASGNVYVTGVYRERVDFDFGPGESFLRSVSTDDVFIAKYTSQGELIWARGIDGSGTDESYDLAVSNSGEVAVTGSFEQTADFDPGPASNPISSRGEQDVFVVKLNADGDFVYARSIGGVGEDTAHTVAFAPDGGIAIGGQFVGTVDFDPGVGVHLQFAPRDFDAFVVRLDAAGQFLWANQLGGTREAAVNGLDVLPDGDVIATGGFIGTVDFDPAPSSVTATSASSDQDAYLWKLDENGELDWARHWGSDGDDVGHSVKFGPDGNVYSVGHFQSSVDFDPGPGEFYLADQTGLDHYSLKLDSAGQFVWAKGWGGGRWLSQSDLKIGANNQLYIAGTFDGVVDFDPGEDKLKRESSGSDDAFLTVLDSDGNLHWTHTVGGEFDDTGTAVAVASDGGAWLGGDFTNSADFDPSGEVFTVDAQDSRDLYLVKLASPSAPTAIALSTNRVLENQPIGTPVGAFLATDSDPGESHSFRLAEGLGDGDNDFFRLDAGVLFTDAMFSHSAKDTYQIRVRVTDRSGRTFEQPLTISVLPVAQAGSIGNRVWLDQNEDGRQDPAEPGIATVVVQAYSIEDGVLRRTTISNEDGTYSLEGLLPGLAYQLVFRVPSYHSFTTADAGEDDFADSDVDVHGISPAISIAAGQPIDSVDAGLVGASADYGFAWATGNLLFDRANAITTDSDGNLYLTGTFGQTVDFDPGPGVFELTSDNSEDGFIAKYTSSGSLIWAKVIEGTAYIAGNDMLLTDDGGILIAGEFRGTADFDPSGEELLIPAQSSTDAFLLRLDLDGNLDWARTLGSQGTDRAFGLADTSDGSVYLTGSFHYTVDFDPGIGTFELTASGSDSDAFVLKLSSDGDFIWAGQLGGDDDDEGSAIAVSPNGDVVLTGRFRQSADMDPGPGTTLLTSEGGDDLFVTMLDPNGALVWTRQFGGPEYELVNAIQITPDGGILTAGRFSATVDFDPGPGDFPLVSAGSVDAFVSKLDLNGGFHWATRWGDVSVDETFALSLDAEANIYAAATFHDTVTFEIDERLIRRESKGSYDVAVVKIGSMGNLLSANTFGSPNDDRAYDLVANREGGVYVAGYVSGEADFDPGTSVSSVPPYGRWDLFVNYLKDPQRPTSISLEQDRVVEKQPIGTVVGKILAENNGEDFPFLFELVSGIGDEDNDHFSIRDEVLSSAIEFDYDLKQSHRIRVRVTTGTGSWFEQALLVHVVDSGQSVTVGDLVWHDQNADGMRDPGEPGLAGFAVEAFSPEDGLSRGRAVTDADGHYQIAGLLPDLEHELVFRVPNGFNFATDVGDNRADSLGRTSAFSPSPGTSLNDLRAGVVGTAPWFGFALGLGAEDGDDDRNRGQSVVSDDDGNVYVSGQFRNTIDFDPGPGVFQLTSSGVYDSYLAKYTSQGSLVWADRFGGSGLIENTSLTLTTSGDLVLAGEFSATSHDALVVGSETLQSRGGTDIFVGRIDATGRLLRVQSFGGVADDRVTGVAATPDGGVVLSGYFSGTSDFDPGPGAADRTSNGGEDIFVLSLDAKGEFSWAHHFGGIRDDQGMAIAVAGDGSVYTTGNFRFTMDLDPGPQVFSLTSDGRGYDVFVSKLNSAGNFVDAMRFGDIGNDYGFAIEVDDAGNVYTGGSFQGSVDFDPGDGTNELHSAGDEDGFLVKTNAAGILSWVYHLGGEQYEYIDDIAIGSAGSVFATGEAWSGWSRGPDFDPGPAEFRFPGERQGDSFLVSLDLQGQFQFARPVPSSRNVQGAGIDAHPDGSIIITSSFVGTKDFAPGDDTYPLHADQLYDAFVWKVHPPGAPSEILLPKNRVMEQQPFGTVVGTLFATDPDPGETFTFELASGPGAEGNSHFLIHDGVLVATSTFDATLQSVYSIRVRATDSTGQSFEQPLQVNVEALANSASVGDHVWNDLNENGIQDPSEPAVPGVVVELFGADDDRTRGIAVTDADGQFSFGGILPENDYYLQFRIPTGFLFTQQNVGIDDELDSDAGVDGKTISFHLATGQHRGGWDAGIVGNPASFGFAFQTGGSGTDAARSVDTDADGNVYVTGSFRGVVDFDPGPGLLERGRDETDTASFVAKYTNRGALIWANVLEGGLSASAESIQVGHDGDLYLTGSYQNRLDYQFGAAVERLDGVGDRSVFVAKLDPNGTPRWFKSFDGGDGSPNKVRVSADGNIYTIGELGQTIDFDPGQDEFQLTGSDDLFISKLSADGEFVWAKSISGDNLEATDLAIHTDGSLHIGGEFRGTADFDPGPTDHVLVSEPSNYDNAFITKLNSDGGFLWTSIASGGYMSAIGGLGVTDNGGVISTGQFAGETDFDPGTDTFTLSAVRTNGFLWKLSDGGEFVWAKPLQSDSYVLAQEIEIATDGSLFVGGRFDGTADLDPSIETVNVEAAEGYDTFLAKFDPHADLIWVQSFGANGLAEMALAADDSLYTVGSFDGTDTDFDPGGDDYRLSSINNDIFVARHRSPSLPTGVVLPVDRVYENQPAGTVVGPLAGVDPVANKAFTFSLVAGVGDSDNASFTIQHGNLVTAGVFDSSTQSTYSIRVEGTDSAGQTVQSPITIQVIPASEAATVRGQLWIDIDENGLRHVNEPPLSSAVAELRTATGHFLLDTVVIDDNGQYDFTNVVPDSNYVVAFRTPNGYAFTLQDEGGDDTVDSDAQRDGMTNEFVPLPATVLTGVDAGVVGDLPTFGFAIGLGSHDDDQGSHVDTDSQGNVYVAGTFSGTVDFDPGPGDFKLHGEGDSNVFVAKYTRLGVFVWARAILGDQTIDPQGFAVTDAGQIVIAANYQGMVDADPGPAELLFDQPGENLVVRLDQSGQLIGASSMPGNVADLVVDAQGAIYLTGQFANTIDFDPGPSTFELTSAGVTDAYITKLDSHADFLWAQSYGGEGQEIPQQIQVGQTGDLYLAGDFVGDVAEFDPGPYATSLTSGAFLLRLTNDGELTWARGLPSENRTVAIADNGSVYGSGRFQNTADFDPGVHRHLLSANSQGDIPIYHLDADGEFQWAHRVGGERIDRANDLVLDVDGDLVAAGSFEDVIDFDLGTGNLQLTSAGEYDALIFGLDSNGLGKRAYQFGGGGEDEALALSAGPDGTVYATGYFSQTATLNSSPADGRLDSHGEQDAFLLALYSNEPPLDISLSDLTLLQGSPTDTQVGQLVTTDPNPSDTFTYTLVTGEGDTHNGFFLINGSTLKTNQVFSAPATYEIRVRSTDRDGQWIESRFDVRVIGTPQISFRRHTPLTEITRADVLVYHAEFDIEVTDVDETDFVVKSDSSAIIASVSPVSGTGETVYAITVSGGDLATFDGDVGIDLAVTQNITSIFGFALPTVEPTTDEVYQLDNTPPRVSSVRLGEGNNSVIDSITVNFDSEVVLDSDAFVLTGDQGLAVTLNDETHIENGATVVVLTFGGALVETGGSLSDGDYILRTLSDRVRDLAGNPLDGNEGGNEGSDAVDRFFRFFGDHDGDRDVDASDLGNFGPAFLSTQGQPNYDIRFDSDHDGDIDASDLGQFAERFLRTL